MIVHELTEDFIENHYFVLDFPYSVEECDPNGFPTGEWLDLNSGTEWELINESYIGGDIHLDGLDTNCWIELPIEDFRRLFTAHKWERGEDCYG